MAPPKASRDSKKRKFTRGSSSCAPPIDSMDEDAEFEYDQHKLELERRQWHRVLGNLPNEVDEVLVKEFYANAYNFDGSLPRQAKNTPYGDFMNEDKDFEAIAARLCIPGESYMIGVSSTPVRILRKHLNSLAHMWSVFSYNNISPNTHTSYINLERSYLIFAIMTGIEIDIGAVISQEITLIVSNATKLRFPALITALCKAKGVVSDTPVLLRLQPPINSRFISKHCMNPAVDHVPTPRPVARPRPPSVPHASSSISEATFQAAMMGGGAAVDSEDEDDDGADDAKNVVEEEVPPDDDA
ncbi:hypothetical protein DEO72_LG6g2010 [Vigna unguiculata]|uniref:Putative plant transposon protein domain-containing protein n=1 Tax=Vigna unguiculata TaxID=3917 RepID=A0A4D6M9C7_VIGUN|nr:hypothetical protein DEO72_LG6g2010 [Vigna unguiculata]